MPQISNLAIHMASCCSSLQQIKARPHGKAKNKGNTVFPELSFGIDIDGLLVGGSSIHQGQKTVVLLTGLG